MFFVLNKEKIYSYIVAVCMVIVLFVVSEAYTKEDSVIVSSNITNEINDINNNSVENNI